MFLAKEKVAVGRGCRTCHPERVALINGPHLGQANGLVETPIDLDAPRAASQLSQSTTVSDDDVVDLRIMRGG